MVVADAEILVGAAVTDVEVASATRVIVVAPEDPAIFADPL